MSELQAALARQAYAIGWARSGGPMTDRVRAGSVAAVSLALEYGGRPGVMEATAELGHREGVDALVNSRRDDLEAGTLAAILAAWRDLVALISRDRLARGLARRMDLPTTEPGEPAEPDAGDDDQGDDSGPDADRVDRDDLAPVILSALQNAAANNPTVWDRLRAAVVAAIAQSWAEGQAGALTQAAHRAFPRRRFDTAAAAAAVVAGQSRTGDVDDALHAMLAAAANELGGKLARLTDPDYRAMRDALDAGLDDPEPRAVKVTAGLINGRAIMRGLLALFGDAEIGKLDMLTEPDACELCVDTAAEGPFRITEAPDLPMHPWCRCTLVPRGSLPRTLVKLLRTFLT